MKKVIFALALLVQTAFAFAGENTQAIAHTKNDDVKLFKQPSTKTEVVKTLKSADDLVVVRKFNNHWTIVTVNGEVGYVRSVSLNKSKESKIALAKPENN
ncbi:SH3 domain-containing protein [Adhaeribacter aquaticus]|uniref:SH3 domain-containing protein n=1 Tax=Adhaeribacter aquaticus TaxID=299567 RepID=UPI0004110AB5|nr:SH3 domain-containing protein [Adhaeribacter aquaticus]